MRNRRKTRCERKRDRYIAICKLVVVGAFLVMLLLLLGLDDAPPAGATVADGAATFAAAQEYERAMERYGDPDAAEYLGRQKYQEVLERWGTPTEPSAAGPSGRLPSRWRLCRLTDGASPLRGRGATEQNGCRPAGRRSGAEFATTKEVQEKWEP